jgi:hypothetical protein
MQIKRPDKRVDCADLEITKFRHGSKPAEFQLCFDRVDYRLIPYRSSFIFFVKKRARAKS